MPHLRTLISFVALALIALFVALPAHAKKDTYVEITSVQPNYSFGKMSIRERMFERGRFKDAPGAWKDYFLDPKWGPDFYEPREGHIGKLITNNFVLGETDAPKKVIIKVGDYLQMLSADSVKPSTESAYSEFIERRNSRTEEVFGLKFMSSYDDVRASLESRGAEIQTTKSIRPEWNSREIVVSSGPMLPSFYDISVDQMTFSTINDKLWSISFTINRDTWNEMRWVGVEKNAGKVPNKLKLEIARALGSKYEASSESGEDIGPFTVPGYDFDDHYRWASDSLIIVTNSNYDADNSDPYYVVEYNHLPSYVEYLPLAREAAQKAEQEALEQKAEQKRQSEEKMQSQL